MCSNGVGVQQEIEQMNTVGVSNFFCVCWAKVYCRHIFGCIFYLCQQFWAVPGRCGGCQGDIAAARLEEHARHRHYVLLMGRWRKLAQLCSARTTHRLKLQGEVGTGLTVPAIDPTFDLSFYGSYIWTKGELFLWVFFSFNCLIQTLNAYFINRIYDVGTTSVNPTLN